MKWLSLLGPLIKLILEIIDLIKRAEDPTKFINESGDTIKQLKRSKTKEEKYAAGKKLQKLLRDL